MNKYYIAGNRGLVGNAMCRLLDNTTGGNTSVIDYTDSAATIQHITDNIPTHIVLNAATVGGICEDMSRSFSIYHTNLTIQNNILFAAHNLGINNLLFQGSGCSYPSTTHHKYLTENDLYSGKPHDAYMPSALCKLIGMEQCIAHNKDYGTRWRTAINTNIFGPHERVGEHAHVVGALMHKFLMATNNNYDQVEVWGSGEQTRDILFVDDAISAYKIIMDNDQYDTVNVSYGSDVSIRYMAETIKEISGFTGKLHFNTDRPEGVMHRRMDNSRLRSLGWYPHVPLEDALEITFDWHRRSHDNTK